MVSVSGSRGQVNPKWFANACNSGCGEKLFSLRWLISSCCNADDNKFFRRLDVWLHWVQLNEICARVTCRRSDARQHQCGGGSQLCKRRQQIAVKSGWRVVGAFWRLWVPLFRCYLCLPIFGCLKMLPNAAAPIGVTLVNLIVCALRFWGQLCKIAQNNLIQIMKSISIYKKQFGWWAGRSVIALARLGAGC